MKSEQHYWLALLRTHGIGPIKGRDLLQAFPAITEIFNAKTAELENLGMPAPIISNIKNPSWELIEKDLKWLEQPNHHLITIENNNYPAILKEIYGAPLALFVDGNAQILNNQQIAIVGSRHPSYAGLDNAYDFAKQLATIGLTITSGLAIGVDAESHKGALDVSGKTIAVLGTGVDDIYPVKNRNIALKIIEQGGAVISEFPLGTSPKPENFPRRNRIISGLSLGVLVIEATMRSGSLITARLAAEQGREVFAIPGAINNPLSRGCHILIRQGAKLVESIEDILEELPILNTNAAKLKLPITAIMSNGSKRELAQDNKAEAKKNLASPTQKLLEYIEYEQTPIDALIDQSGLSVQNISSHLLILELQGLIKKTCGGYVRI
jgi:DNA processing protein